MRRLRLVIAGERGGSSLTPSVVDDLRAALEAESGARIVTIEGRPGAFCTGIDPEVLAKAANATPPPAGNELLARFAALLDAIERAPRPVMALVDGPAMGGGLGIAAAADLVLATPRATFSLPETLFGLLPAMVFPVVARRVGVPRARWLALGAARLSAKEAFRLGLVDRVVPDLEAACERYMARLIRMDPRALAEVKILAADHQTLPAASRAEAASRFTHLLASRETQERLARFARGETPWPEEATW